MMLQLFPIQVLNPLSINSWLKLKLRIKQYFEFDLLQVKIDIQNS